MKQLKLCMILLSVLFVTGCSVKYDIEIMDGNISETASFKFKNKYVINNNPYYTLQQMSYKYFINSDFLITQEKKEYSDDNHKYIDLKNTFDMKEYLNSYALSICYSAYNVMEVNSAIQITTSNKFLCYDRVSELLDVVVTAKTNHKVIEHNADEVVNDEYKWKITRENANNKPIKFIVSNDVKSESLFDKLANNIITILIIGGILLLIGGIIIINIFINSKRVNKI